MTTRISRLPNRLSNIFLKVFPMAAAPLPAENTR